MCSCACPHTLKLYKLPETMQTPGLRPLTKADIPQVSIGMFALSISCLTGLPVLSGSGCRKLTTDKMMVCLA